MHVQYVVLGPDEKDVNEYFLSWKKSIELKHSAVLFIDQQILNHLPGKFS